jgi:hypothetical protein
VEWPLTLVAVRNVVDDHRFITDTPALLVTPAALGVDDSHVANTYEVLSPFKLMMPWSKSKEPYLSPLPPERTQAMVAWCTCLNQLQAKYSGICSDPCCATSYSISLLPWDPGEKTKSGYATIQKYFLGLIQVLCSSQNAIGSCSCTGIYAELLQNQFDCADPFSKQLLEYLIACAPTYLASCAKQVVNNCQPQYLGVSELCYCSKLRPGGAIDHGPGYFQWALAAQRYTSSGTVQKFLNYIGFPAILSKEAQSEFGFSTMGNIIFGYCVLKQWKIPRTVSFLSLKC